MQKKLSMFLSGFFLSGVIITGVIGFIMVDYSTDKYGSGLIPPMVQVEKSLDRWGIYFLGKGLAIETEDLNQTAKFIQDYYTVFIPAPMRIFVQLNYLTKLGINELKEYKLELEWRKNMGLPLF